MTVPVTLARMGPHVWTESTPSLVTVKRDIEVPVEYTPVNSQGKSTLLISFTAKEKSVDPLVFDRRLCLTFCTFSDFLHGERKENEKNVLGRN